MKYLLGIMIVLFIAQIVEGQSPQGQTNLDEIMYLVVGNANNSQLVVWNTADNTTQELFSLENISDVTVEDGMSVSELHRLAGLLDNYLYSQVISYLIKQELTKVWFLQDETLLLETKHYRCVSAPDRNCYGYYEYSIFDISSQTLRSIVTVDFHSKIHDDPDVWCSDIEITLPSNISIYPDQHLILMGIRPPKSCLEPQSLEYVADPSQIYTIMIDWENIEQPNVETLSAVWGLSISSDGNIAYYRASKCEARICTVEFGTSTSLSNQAELKVIESLGMELRQFTSLDSVWEDNNIINYAWSTDLTAYQIYQYDLNNRETIMISTENLGVSFINGNRLMISDNTRKISLYDFSAANDNLEPIDENWNMVVASASNRTILGSQGCLQNIVVVNSVGEIQSTNLPEFGDGSCIRDISFSSN